MPIKQPNKPGFTLASFLLLTAARVLFAVGAFVMSSCLSPQTIDPTPIPPRQPPVIDYTGVSPSVAVVCLSAEGPKYSFSLPVRSPDQKPLSVRWFIDYDPNKAATTVPRIPTFALDPSQNNGVSVFEVQLDEAELGFDSSSTGIHTLEVVIATGFSQDTTAQPPFQAVASGGWSTSYKWVINYTGTLQCPSPT